MNWFHNTGLDSSTEETLMEWVIGLCEWRLGYAPDFLPDHFYTATYRCIGDDREVWTVSFAQSTLLATSRPVSEEDLDVIFEVEACLGDQNLKIGLQPNVTLDKKRLLRTLTKFKLAA